MATPPLYNPTALASFDKLDVVARLVVEGFMAGRHKSPFKGASVEFVEHRKYYPGDEVRHIDWRAYGKTGKYFIKEYEDETNLRCYLLVDCSGSMGYAGKTLSKFAYASHLAAALAHLLLQQRDAVGLITFDTKVRDRLEPSAKPQTFSLVVDALQNRQPGEETSLASVFQHVIPTLKRRSLVVILSDCFDDLGPLAVALRQFRHQHHEVLLLQIVAPEEETFPFSQPTQFRNLEQADHRLLVDPHRLRAHYQSKYQAFCKELNRVAGSCGIDCQKLITEQPYDVALGAYLDARTRGKKKTSGEYR